MEWAGAAVVQVNGQGPINQLTVDGTLDLKSNGTLTLGTNAYAACSELTGTGTIAGSPGSILYVRDLLAAGQSPGPLQIDTTVSLGSNAISQFELGGTAAGEFDQVLGLTELWINGSELAVSLYGTFSLSSDMQFKIFDIQGSSPTSITGIFDSLNEGALVDVIGGQNLFITYSGGDGNDIVLYTTAVPEPSALMIVFSFVGVCCLRRRKRMPINN